MKKSYVKLLIASLAMIFTNLQLQGRSDMIQADEDVKDLGEKTLIVVLENNSMIDLSLKKSVTKVWDLSNYKFCTPTEFESIKTDTSFYFLMRVKGLFKKESDPTIEFLSLVKGGKEAEMGIDNMFEVLSLPFQALDDGNNYILPFIDTYITVFKTHIQRLQEKKIAATMGIGWYSNRLSKIGKKTILFNENDLSGKVEKEYLEQRFKGNATVVDEDAIEQALIEQAKDTLVSICIAPQEPQHGSYCYKMLVGADNNELYYFKKHKITESNPKGFLPGEIKRIATHHTIF